MKRTLLCVATAAALLCVIPAPPARGQALVRNPSFESNWNVTWPHYGPVDEWPGASGVNGLSLDPGGPFHNAGTPVPDRVRVGFKQGNGDVSQVIYGLSRARRTGCNFSTTAAAAAAPRSRCR